MRKVLAPCGTRSAKRGVWQKVTVSPGRGGIMDLFEGKGKLMRHFKIYSPDDIDESEIVKGLKVVKE